MELREVINEIRRKKNWDGQTIAGKLNVDPTTISKLGVRWDEHWDVFLKLDKLCKELGIDPHATAPARELLESDPAGEALDAAIYDTTGKKAHRAAPAEIVAEKNISYPARPAGHSKPRAHKTGKK